MAHDSYKLIHQNSNIIHQFFLGGSIKGFTQCNCTYDHNQILKYDFLSLSLPFFQESRQLVKHNLKAICHNQLPLGEDNLTRQQGLHTKDSN